MLIKNILYCKKDVNTFAETLRLCNMEKSDNMSLCVLKILFFPRPPLKRLQTYLVMVRKILIIYKNSHCIIHIRKTASF